ncbi:variable surface protein [Plasmodium gonderi]|uniref:Variable surface protein n=1 Tax=Plasmodium gonderi TaxID=77519 RepID=A0A1Y1JR43_PLAGO|nr:variable surface protein [Plasmodium gonderi]GAW83965.1 variable surface protein [Plasmodium gonderi]
MNEGANMNINFNFSDIYPKCRDDFKRVYDYQYFSFKNYFSSACSDFCNNLNIRSIVPFNSECQYLGVYLYNIDKRNKEKTDSNFNLSDSCKYFYYKLKELVMRYGGNCHTAKECYDRMLIKNEKKSYKEHFSNICKDMYSNHYHNNKLIQTLKKLEEQYNLYDQLRSATHPSYWDILKLKGYIKSLEECDYKNNDSFKDILSNVKNNYEVFENSLKDTQHGRTIYYSYLYPEPKITKVSRPTEVTVAARVIGTQKITEVNETKELWTDAGIGTNVVIFACSMLIILFILYKVKNKLYLYNVIKKYITYYNEAVISYLLHNNKNKAMTLYFQYTPFGSYLQIREKRLRKQRKRKNNVYTRLNNSYKRINKELKDKQYEIAYRSL